MKTTIPTLTLAEYPRDELMNYEGQKCDNGRDGCCLIW